VAVNSAPLLPSSADWLNCRASRSAVLIQLTGHIDHWTVLRRATGQSLTFLDSSGHSRISLTSCRTNVKSHAMPGGRISSSRRGFSWCVLGRTEERRAVHLGSAPNPFRAALSEKTANHIGDCAEALMALVANECSRRILARTP
jgi:hypothetical protein